MTVTEIWNTYHDDLKRFICSKIVDEDVANDILQEVFVKAQLNLKSVEDQSKLKAWLFTITRNLITDYFRKNPKGLHIDKDITVYKDDSSSSELEQKHSEKDCLRGIIKSLPKKYRDPLFLSDIKGIKQKDIAIQLKLPLPTIKSQIQRARKLIVKGYMECCDYKLNEQGYLVGEIKDKEECKVCKE